MAISVRTDALPEKEPALTAKRRGISRSQFIVEARELPGPRRRMQLLEWISLRGLQVVPFDAGDLVDLIGWLHRHTEPRKTEMAFADASLYWRSGETGITEILTIDVDDSARHRLPDGRAFELH